MGRGIIAIFFVIGFFIFLFIKYASIGVKGAYNAVKNIDVLNKPASSPFVDTSSSKQRTSRVFRKVSHLIAYALNSQMSEIRALCSIDSIDERVIDFTIGYVVGITHEIIAQGYSEETPNADPIELEAALYVSHEIFIKNMFGAERGQFLSNRIIDLLRHPSAQFAHGKRDGALDAYKVLNEPGFVPRKWVDQVLAAQPATLPSPS